MAEVKPSHRVMEHIEALRNAGLDTEAFFEALVAIRDDSMLPAKHREVLYKLIAMENFVWYVEALRGAPIDRFKAMEEVSKLRETHEVAIKKRTRGDIAAELASKDLDIKPPQDQATALERPLQAKGPSTKPGLVDDGPTVLERPPTRKISKPPASEAATKVDRPLPKPPSKKPPKKG